MLAWEELGTRIDTALQEADMSQTDLANKLGLHPSAVSRIVRGDRKVDSVELTQLAEVVGLPVWWFLEERPDMDQVFMRASGAAQNSPTRDAIDLFKNLLSEYRWLRSLEV